MIEEQLKKLPKWAQEHIAVLEQNLSRRNKQIAEMLGESPSDVKFFDSGTYRSLPSRSTVDFFLRPNFNVSCSVVDGELRIYGSSAIQILPRAANSVYIK